MEVVLIFRQLSKKEERELSDLYYSRNVVDKHAGAPGSSELYHKEIKPALRVIVQQGIKLDLAFGTEELNSDFIKDSAKELVKEIRDLGDFELENRSISELLTIERMPLWHYQRFRVFFLLKNEWLINNCINHFAQLSECLTCYVPHNFQKHDYDYNNIRLVKPSYDSNSKITSQSIKYRTIINYSIFFTLRVILGLLNPVNMRGRRYAAIDRSIRQQCKDIRTLKEKNDNFNLYPLFDSQTKELLIISEVETPKFTSPDTFTLHKYYFSGEGRSDRTVYGESILFKGLISLSVYKNRSVYLQKYENAKLRIFQHFNTYQFLKDSSFTKRLRIIDTFFSLNKSTGFFIFKYLCYQKFFKKNKFNSVTAIDENSPATRAILDAARSKNIKIIGIQHGNIGDSQPAYMYSVKDAYNNVMTDQTIVWGEYWAKALVEKGNYRSDTIKIAGQMRSDVIPAMIQRAAAYRSALSDREYIVLFASQPIRDEIYRYRMAFDIFSCFAKNDNVKLVLKLHPAEKGSVEYYKKIANEAGFVNPDIRYEYDLYELLAASDIVITAFSTVGSEAVYFGKTLIIYDPYKEDLLNYVKEKVAIQVTDLATLKTAVDHLTSGSLKANASAYSQFIRKYAYSIDGMATERTIEFIRQS